MLSIFIVVLATTEALDIWFHSSLLSRSRAYVDNLEGPIAELLRCRFCLTVWIAFVSYLVYIVGQWQISDGYYLNGMFTQAPLYGLACAKLADLLHAAVKDWDGVPKHDQLPEGWKEVEPADEPDETRSWGRHEENE